MSAKDIAFSDSIYSTNDFIRGITISNPVTPLFTDTLYSFPLNKPVNVDSLFLNNKYYFVTLYSPYTCSSCYHADFDIINYFAKKYPEQVYLLIEYWDMRDVFVNVHKLKLDLNVHILLDKKGKNILKLSRLDEAFTNAGYLIIDKNYKIKYIIMGSFKHPYTEATIKKLFKKVDYYLKKK